MKQVRVALHTTDPVIRAGLTRFLQFQPGLRVLPEPETATADVLAVATHRLTTAHIAELRRHADSSRTPVVLIVDEIAERELLIAISLHVGSILPLPSVTGRTLTDAVRAVATGGGMMPPKLTGMLLDHLKHLQHEVFNHYELTSSRLTTREIDVIRLIADGMDTKEIAARLNYTRRTIKSLLEAASRRLHLRNRTHAVAYAIRTGTI